MADEERQPAWRLSSRQETPNPAVEIPPFRKKPERENTRPACSASRVTNRVEGYAVLRGCDCLGIADEDTTTRVEGSVSSQRDARTDRQIEAEGAAQAQASVAQPQAAPRRFWPSSKRWVWLSKHFRRGWAGTAARRRRRLLRVSQSRTQTNQRTVQVYMDRIERRKD